MSNFYADWFAITQPKPLTPQQVWEQETRHLRDLATSPMAEELVEHIDVPEVDEAEAQFRAALQTVSDPEAREKLDTAAGMISRAYQILGFCAGRFSQNSRTAIF